MRKSKFTDSQIMDAVKRVAAGFSVPDICRELGISTATLNFLTQVTAGRPQFLVAWIHRQQSGPCRKLLEPPLL